VICLNERADDRHRGEIEGGDDRNAWNGRSGFLNDQAVTRSDFSREEVSFLFCGLRENLSSSMRQGGTLPSGSFEWRE
jgi:hypothetical protein